jgi:hypothetical protein
VEGRDGEPSDSDDDDDTKPLSASRRTNKEILSPPASNAAQQPHPNIPNSSTHPIGLHGYLSKRSSQNTDMFWKYLLNRPTSSIAFRGPAQLLAKRSLPFLSYEKTVDFAVPRCHHDTVAFHSTDRHIKNRGSCIGSCLHPHTPGALVPIEIIRFRY